MTQVPPKVAEGFRLYQSMPDALDFSELNPDDVDGLFEMWSVCRYWFERNCTAAADWMDSHPAGDFFRAIRDGYEVVEATGIHTDERDWIPWDTSDRPWVPRDI